MRKDRRVKATNHADAETGGGPKSTQSLGRRILSTVPTKLKSAAVIAAAMGACAAILAAILGGFFLLVQPAATRLIDDYWNRTTDIQVADVRAASAAGKPTIDVVLLNSTAVSQVVVSIEIGLRQEGAHLLLIDKSVYELSGEIEMDNESGALSGTVQAPNFVAYKFGGSLETPARGGWSLLLDIPVREALAPGASRSVLLVVPAKINLATRDSAWLPSWIPSSADTGRLPAKYLGGNGSEFLVHDFLRGRGRVAARIRVRRGDGKTAARLGSIEF